MVGSRSSRVPSMSPPGPPPTRRADLNPRQVIGGTRRTSPTGDDRTGFPANKAIAVPVGCWGSSRKRRGVDGVTARKRSLLYGSATVLIVAGLAFGLFLLGRGSVGREEYDGLPAMSVNFDRIYLPPGLLAHVFVPAAVAVSGERAEIYFEVVPGRWVRLRGASWISIWRINDYEIEFDGRVVSGYIDWGTPKEKRPFSYTLSDSDRWR